MKNIKTYLLFFVLAVLAVGCEPDGYEVPDIEQVPVKIVHDIVYEIDGKEKSYLDDALIPFSITLYDTKDMMTWYKDPRAIEIKEVTNKDESASTDEDFVISFDTVEKVTVVDDEGNESTELVVESYVINTSKVNSTAGTMSYTFTKDGEQVTRIYRVRAREDKVYN